MNAELIIFFLVLLMNLFIVFMTKIYWDFFQRQKERKIKKYIDSIISVNVSHLHDASNFFSIIKQEASQKDLPDLENFARGASFHFRSLFDELKSSFDSFMQMEFKHLHEENLNIFYKKEIIDLKDIISLELFQLGNLQRISVKDNTNSEHALICGNFSLVSKAILNLIENALKYTDENIKLELNDKHSKWQLKISSFGTAIPIEIAEAINNGANNNRQGHGLTSLIDVMKYHDAEAHIDTFADDGTCVIIDFEKFINSKVNPVKPKIKNDFNFIPSIIVLVSIAFVVTTVMVVRSHNKSLCENFYTSKIAVVHEQISDPEMLAKREFCLASLKDLKQLIEGFDSANETRLVQNIQEIIEIRNELIAEIYPKDQNLADLLIYNFLNQYAYIRYKSFLDKEAVRLVEVFPDSVYLNHTSADYYYANHQISKALFYSMHEIFALIESNFYTDADIYFSMKVFDEHNSMENLSWILAQMLRANAAELYPPTVELVSDEVNDSELATEGSHNGDKQVPNAKPKSIQSVIPNNQLDKLIEQQDSNLGLNTKAL